MMDGALVLARGTRQRGRVRDAQALHAADAQFLVERTVGVGAHRDRAAGMACGDGGFPDDRLEIGTQSWNELPLDGGGDRLGGDDRPLRCTASMSASTSPRSVSMLVQIAGGVVGFDERIRDAASARGRPVRRCHRHGGFRPQGLGPEIVGAKVNWMSQAGSSGRRANGVSASKRLLAHLPAAGQEPGHQILRVHRVGHAARPVRATRWRTRAVVGQAHSHERAVDQRSNADARR